MKERQNIWFISDTHFSHKNIVKYTKRPEIMGLDIENDMEWLNKHDEWLINKWNETVKKKDIVYILGDFSFASAENTEKILNRLHGKKHLILGNHDGVISDSLKRYFESVSQIKELIFKQNPAYPFLEETFTMILCHYPILSWNKRNYGSCMVHGHCHGTMNQYNVESGELRLDVGLDSDFMNYNFISLEELYRKFKEISQGKPFLDYMQEKFEKNM